MIKVYVDASYLWRKELNKKVKSGKVSYQIENEKIEIKEIKIPEINNLNQYINLFEFLAIITAMKELIKRNLNQEEIVIYTDSYIAKSWFEKEKNFLMKFSDFHYQLKEECDSLKNNFKNLKVELITRKNNPAGYPFF